MQLESPPPMPNDRYELSKGFVVFLVVSQIGLGLLLSQLYSTSHNSLYNNGDWSVTKTRLWNGLMGSYAYLFDLQPLSSGFLNVAAWHGYQEVILEREFDPVSVEFDFLLAKPNSYVTFSFNRAGRRYSAIRLGRHREHPAALLKVSREGEFFRKRLLRSLYSAGIGEWQRFRIEFADDGFSAFLNDREVDRIKKLRTRVVRPQKIGFRGGARPVFVDNIRIVSRDGSEFLETFNRPRHWLLVNVIAIGSVVLLAWSAFFVIRRVTSIGDKHLLFFLLMFTGVLLVVVGAMLGLVVHKKGFYPNASEKLRRQEAYWKDSNAEKLFRDIEERYPRELAPNTRRIIFLGSSQTAGAGAPSEEETWVRRTERLLNQRSKGLRYECINAAQRGYVLKEMVRDFEERWIAWKPTTLIVNASNNDRGAPERFEKYLTRLVRRAQSAEIRVVLIQEPNAGRRVPKGLLRLHETMAAIGSQYGVPVIDMQGPLAKRADDGFLWWDHVHMTSFGQRLFAESLVEALEQIGVVALD